MGNTIKSGSGSISANTLISGDMSRRHFMERMLALGLTIPLASMSWTSQVRASTPKKGGTFRVGLSDSNTADTLDPGTAYSNFSIQSNQVFRSYLTEIKPDGVVGPDSAESWEPSKDAKIWRFRLYKGQQFHNGRPLTADDVVASLNHHRGASSTSGGKALLQDVEDIAADGQDTVVIRLAVGTADFPYILSDYHMAIMPADGKGGVDWASGIGAGPYKLANFQPGVKGEYQRFENYHRQTYFDAIQLFGINDVNARMNSLVAKEIDAVNAVDLKTVDMLSQMAGIKIVEIRSGTLVSMDMRCETAPFNNNDVRLALKYAMDRKEILEKIALGHASIGNDQPIGPTLPYYADLEQRAYDPDRAKFHLKKANMESLAVALSTSEAAYNGATDLAVLYQQSAAKAGIKVDVIREPADGYWSNVWGKKPFFMDHNGQRATPDMMFSTFNRRGGAWNPTGWDNDRFQTLLVQAKGELDQTKRAEMYREMQTMYREEGGQIVVFFTNIVDATQENVMHPDQMSSNWELDGGRAYQRWWFDT
ncbi:MULTISPECIES: ABC transporter substrate-binding protein [unclassified Mesorhizobium]|uniref:ABC transporter substrate-binding protein n=1 Tax=unclassified Mesorhizobium TaxID=325217 RepID=UPI0015E2E216|nr:MULTISPECIES: ABC transporter substrate-binding protein [unclassified Mesorhizobium]